MSITRAQAEYRRVRYADAIAARNARLAEQQVRDAAAELLAALQAALPRLAHKAECRKVRPTEEWATHGSVSFDNCQCEIRQAEAAIARATGTTP